MVNRRDALKLGAVLGVSLATPALNPDQAGELVASLENRQITHAGVAARAPSSRPTVASTTRSGPPPSARWSSTTSRSSRGCRPGPRTLAPR